MPRINEAAALASRLIDELAAGKQRGAGDYPIPWQQLVERVAPQSDPVALTKALGRPEFKKRAVVALPGQPGALVAFLEDGTQLAEHPRALEATLATLGAESAPPWTVAQLAGKLATALRPQFKNHLSGLIGTGQLPSFVGTVRKGKTVRLHHRDHPPPPPPPPKEVELAEQLVDLVRRRKAAGGAGYPFTVGQLADLAGLPATDKLFLKALKVPAFTDHIVQAGWKGPDPLALREDLTELAGSAVLLNRLFDLCERHNAHAFPAQSLAAQVENPKKARNPLKGALIDSLEAEGVDRHLPAGIGYVLVGIGNKPGQRCFLRLEHLRTGRPAPAALVATAAPAIPREGVSAFADAFDATFARLDREAGANNFVSLVRLRRALADVPRGAFDAQLRQLRRAGRYRLSVAEGYGGLSPEERAAGILENGELLLNVSRAQP